MRYIGICVVSLFLYFNILGNALAEEEKIIYRQEIAIYSAIIEHNPKDAIAYYNRGTTYAHLGQYQQAIQDLTQALSLKPDYAKAYYNRGVVYNRLEYYQQAISDYSKTIELDSQNINVIAYGLGGTRNKNALVYNNLGELYRRLGNYQKALQCYQQAIKLDPQNSFAYYNLGWTYYKVKRPYLSVRAYLMGFLHDKNALYAVQTLSLKDIFTGHF